MMHPLQTVLIFFLFGGAVMLSPARADLAQYAPEETLAILQVRSMESLGKRLVETALFEQLTGRTAEDSLSALDDFDFDEFFAEKTGEDFSLEPVLHGLKGDLLIALVEIPEPESSALPGFLVMADYPGDAAELHIWMEAQFERNGALNPALEREIIEERVGDAILYFDRVDDGEETYIEDGYTVAEEVLIYSNRDYLLRDAAERLAERRARGSLAGDPAYSDALARIEEAGAVDFLLYLSVEQILSASKVWLSELTEQAGFINQSLSPDDLLDITGMDGLTAMIYGIRLAGDSLEGETLITARKMPELIQRTYDSGEPLPFTGFVPDDAIQFTVSCADMSALLDEIEEMLTQISPMGAMLMNQQLASLKNNQGLDVRAALLDNLLPGLINFSMVADGFDGGSAEEIYDLYALKLRDPAALENFIEAALDLAAPGTEILETSNYLGYEIRRLNPALNPGGIDLAFAIADGTFILSIGSDQLLRDTLSLIQDPLPEIAERTAYAAYFDELPADIKGILHYDLGAVFEVIGEMIEEFDMSEFTDGHYSEFVGAIDFSGVAYSFFAAYWLEGETFRQRSILQPSPETTP